MKYLNSQYYVILGLQWGDEGKGKIVDCLSENVDCVVRFQGGNNAGHTLVINGNKTVLHLLPSGVFAKNTLCCISHGVVLDCQVLCDEISKLQKQGVSIDDRLFIDYGCPLILPTHLALDRGAEKQRLQQDQISKPIGTTKCGIGPAYEDHVARRALHFADLANPSLFATKLEKLMAYHNFLLEKYYQMQVIDYRQTKDQLLDCYHHLASFSTDVSKMLLDLGAKNKKILFEGGQGALLDIYCGSYPYVTSSSTTIGGVMTGCGLPLFSSATDILGVIKAYVTRVGNGPFPTHCNNEIGDYLVSQGHEFGATTNRRRSCGWFDAVLGRYAVKLNGVTKLCLTKLDVLDNLSELKICVGYQVNGGKEMITWPPLKEGRLADCSPCYETLPGWLKSTAGITDYQALPSEAKNYIKRLEELLSVPVGIVSTGPDREHTLIYTR